MNPPSIRQRLLLRCGLATGLLLFLLSTGVYLIVRQSLYRELDESIQQTAALLANQVELEGGEINYEWQEGLGTNQAIASDDLFQFWNEKTGVTTRSPDLYHGDLLKFTGEDGRPALRNIRLPGGHRARAVGTRIYPFVLPAEMAAMKERNQVIDPRTLSHILVVARDSEPVHRTLEHLRLILACGAVLMLGIGFMVIERVVRRALRPIDELAEQVHARAEHQLDVALDVPGELPSELAGLAKNFDTLLWRVAAIRQRERDFIRHAAHELRTPIAGLRATTDLALSQPREAAAYAYHLATCQKTAIELGELVKRLSALSRIGQGNSPPVLEAVDLGGLTGECLQAFAGVFEERGLKVKKDFGADPLVAKADRALARIILNNLLDNAASYASEGSEVVIEGSKHAQVVEIRVSNICDDTPGDLNRLFEPLFRKETSRTDSGAHLGIGLTLSLEAAKSMSAGLKSRMAEEKRIEFALTLPKA